MMQSPFRSPLRGFFALAHPEKRLSGLKNDYLDGRPPKTTLQAESG